MALYPLKILKANKTGFVDRHKLVFEGQLTIEQNTQITTYYISCLIVLLQICLGSKGLISSCVILEPQS